jgi:hypothetical protein
MFLRVDLEIVEKFQNGTDERWFYRKQHQLAAGFEYASKLAEPVIERDVLEHAARYHDLK